MRNCHITKTDIATQVQDFLGKPFSLNTFQVDIEMVDKYSVVRGVHISAAFRKK